MKNPMDRQLEKGLFLCSKGEAQVFKTVREQGKRFRSLARGYALGSGSSIADYVPAENYRAMVRAAQPVRADQS